MQNELLERERVQSIIGAFYEVYNYYGFGLAESVYAGALEREPLDRGHEVAREVAVSVFTRGWHIGWQRLDMLVDRKIIVENKATEKLPAIALPQLISYLQATPYEVGLLLHFGPKPHFEKRVHTDKRPFVRPAVNTPL